MSGRAPNETMVRIARAVGARLADGWSHSDALSEAAAMLGCSPQAVAHCCNEVGAWFHDEYLEGFEGWKS